MKTAQQLAIRANVRGVYDLQAERIRMGQRILAQFLAKLGLPPEPKSPPENETKEEREERLKRKAERDQLISYFCEKLGISQKEDDDKKKITSFLDLVILDYKGIVDYVTSQNTTLRKAIPASSMGIISDISEIEILQAYFMLEEAEKKAIKVVQRSVEQHPLWTEFLKDVKGVGPMMAGVIIASFDIEIARYVSSFWKIAGLDTVAVPIFDKDGEPVMVYDEATDSMVQATKMEARSRKASHLVEREYIDKNGAIQTKKSITYDPFLHTKLLGVLGSSFLKGRGHYSEVYHDYRNRIDNMPEHADKTPKHRHNMANRYAVKYFVQDLFLAWSMIVGKGFIKGPYHEEKLNMQPHSKQCPQLIEVYKRYRPDLLPAGY